MFHLPERFRHLLEQDSNSYGAVLSTLSAFEPVLKANRLPFFPEYTEHGLDHLSAVVRTSASLISDKAWESFSTHDAALLIIASLLHDLGLHTTEDAFLSLINPENTKVLAGTEDRPWPEIWLDYTLEARRFSETQLQAIFGDTQPVTMPEDKPEGFTKRDRLLIGEFLRRHHHRLAHEIARFGFPSMQSVKIECVGLPEDMCDLAGIVARSHGKPIRAALSLLRKYDPRQYKESHPVFLMALLRISDYLHVTSERAPETLLRVQRLRSPVSQKEWEIHQAIRDIRSTHEDPEAIFIDALPQDGITYVRLRRLLSRIQHELDSSWALLGEIYGRFPVLRDLGLALRRVRSTLDDEVSLRKTVSFIPREARFDTAPRLLQLMIYPLYGENPGYGIRELVQNSVDAVRERREYIHRQDAGIQGAANSKNRQPDVVVDFEFSDDQWWLTITDKGIGMNEDIIINYFLKAGASYRESDSWRQVYENSKGRARIIRSGRFGIGALAAFLLGDKLLVSTRRAGSAEEEGIEFQATTSAQNIELRRINCPVGTSIKVRLRENPFKKDEDLVFDTEPTESPWYKLHWYRLREPSVRILTPDTVTQESYEHIPGALFDLPMNWQRIKHRDYLDIQWTYSSAPYLSCNGIIIQEAESDRMFLALQGQVLPSDEDELDARMSEDFPQEYRLKVPNVSVFDPYCNLPLNLQRTGLTTEHYPFDGELLEDVVCNLIAFFLVNTPTEAPSCTDDLAINSQYEGSSFHRWSQWMFFQDGATILDDWCLRRLKPRRALVAAKHPDQANINLSHLMDSETALLLYEPDSFNPERSFVTMALYESFPSQEKTPSCFVKGRRLLLSKKILSRVDLEDISSERLRIEGGDIERATRKDLEPVETEWEDENYIMLTRGEPEETEVSLARLLEDLQLNSTADWYCLAEWHFGFLEKEPVLRPIAEGWNKVLGYKPIAYDIEMRREEHKSAYARLDSHIKSHKQCKKRREERDGLLFGLNEGSSVGVPSLEDLLVDSEATGLEEWPLPDNWIDDPEDDGAASFDNLPGEEGGEDDDGFVFGNDVVCSRCGDIFDAPFPYRDLERSIGIPEPLCDACSHLDKLERLGFKKEPPEHNPDEPSITCSSCGASFWSEYDERCHRFLNMCPQCFLLKIGERIKQTSEELGDSQSNQEFSGEEEVDAGNLAFDEPPPGKHASHLDIPELNINWRQTLDGIKRTAKTLDLQIAMTIALERAMPRQERE